MDIVGWELLLLKTYFFSLCSVQKLKVGRDNTVAIRKVYIGTVGPFTYDDALTPHGVRTDGQISIGKAPKKATEVARLGDIPTSTKSYAVGFSSVTSVTILGTEHKLATTDISVTVWDDSNPRVKIDPSSVTVDSTSFDIVITFLAAKTGRAVLIG